MTTFPISKYENDHQVKWIVAQRIDGGDWFGRYLSFRLDDGTGTDKIPTFDRIFDETPIGEMRKSEFAIFRNRPGIEDYLDSPRRYWRGPEVKTYLSSSLAGLINTVQSDLSFS
jgi:hypothetical protein